MEYPRLFLDTADVDEIRDAVTTGIIDGVATNPNKLMGSGIKPQDVVDEIRSFFEGPIALQALGRTADELEEDALRLNELGPNLAVKIPTTYEGLKAIKRLLPQGVATNATLIFNPGQGLAAGLAGSPFISPFIGRSKMAGADGIDVIRDIRECYDAFGIETCIVGASIKDVQQAIEAIKAGAHSIAVTYPVLQGMLSHPGTQVGLDEFIRNAADLG